eukprot:SAG25_NODE_8_length_29132_cov_108.213895_22_plen_64_part_00
MLVTNTIELEKKKDLIFCVDSNLCSKFKILVLNRHLSSFYLFFKVNLLSLVLLYYLFFKKVIE